MLTRCRRRIGPYRCCSVVRGDSAKLMAALPPASVQVVWSDPPYGHNNQRGDLQAALARRAGRRCRPIANDSPERMRSVVDSVLLQAWRVLDTAASAVCVACAGGGAKGIPTFAWLAERMDSAGLAFFHAVIWDKLNPGLGWRYRRQYEMVMVAFRRGGELRWNAAAPAKGNIVRLSAPHRRAHPNEKPLGLVKYFIERHSRPGDVVLDPFLGSGTTAVAAAETGRHYLGFELSESYCKIARRRIATAQKGAK